MVRKLLAWYWDNTKHKWHVGKPMVKLAFTLIWRAIVHDLSKYQWAEAKHFITQHGRLRGSTYASEDYNTMLDRIRPALEHHYAKNSHHPENHRNGIRDMSLPDEIEMVFDWIGACKKHADGDPFVSIEKNKERFSYGEERASFYRKAVDFSAGAVSSSVKDPKP